MNESTTLTNRERRENVAFLGQAFLAAQKLPAEILDAEQRDRFTSDEQEQSRLFYTLLCYGALAAQPAPESVVDADWRRLGDAGVVDALFSGEFDLKRYALDPPVSRNDSKGKIIDFVRLAETRDTWGRLLPQPPDPEVAVDVLHAASGGALKSRAFWAVREMRRYGLWDDEAQTALISQTIVDHGLPLGHDGVNSFSQEAGAEFGMGRVLTNRRDGKGRRFCPAWSVNASCKQRL